MEIGTYIKKAIVSELSGNVIDVCPVGALTAKPSRYTARPWELVQHAAVSPHDCVGSNCYVHTRGREVIRVVPRENEAINESWIADRDRFSYTALKTAQRLETPMLREQGVLRPTDWETALNEAANRLAGAGGSIAALISPQATLEEHYLAQKLLRALGSNHIDHRLSQTDFSAQQQAPLMPWLGRSLESVENLDAALIVGGSLRFEQPLLSHRLRKAVLKNNAAVSSIGHVGGQYNFALQNELNGSAAQLVANLAGVASAAARAGEPLGERLAKLVEGLEPTPAQQAIASSLAAAGNAAIIVGLQALASPYLSLIQELCEAITARCGATLGYLSPSANGAGACLAGATPHRGPAGAALDKPGEHCAQMLTAQHKVLLAIGLNPPLDARAASPLSDNNEFVIAIASFDNDFVQQQADLVLPMAAIFETSGSYVNVEGLWQSFKACVPARGDSRQGWKILAALGQVVAPGEFDYADSLVVRNELKDLCSEVSLSNLCGVESKLGSLPADTGKLQKLGITPIYAGDEMTRLSAPLQATPLAQMQGAVLMNGAQARQAKLADCEQVQVRQGQGTAVLPFRIDESVPDGCVYVHAGIDAASHLPAAFGKVELEKVS